MVKLNYAKLIMVKLNQVKLFMANLNQAKNNYGSIKLG